LPKYPNDEIWEICKQACAPFVKGGKWEPNEELPFDVIICDKSGREPKVDLPKEGYINLFEQDFSVGLRWKETTERWNEAGWPNDVSVTQHTDLQKDGVDIGMCIDAFNREETLRESEAWYCSKCKKHMCATKKFDLWRVPDVLVIHLKRLTFNSIFRDKITTYVDFPVEALDMGKWIANDKEERSTIYDLYAVSNHYGGLGGGHYTAFGKNLLDQQWYHLDDSQVTPLSNTNQIKTAAAYVLFYKRREKK